MAGTGKGTTPRQRLVGDRVRERRHALGLSQEALAHRAVLNRTYIATLERGERNPSLETICALALALEADVSDLVGGTQDVPGRSR